MRSIPRLIEPDYIETILLTGILPPENLGDMFRITGYEDRIRSGGLDRVVRLRVALSPENYHAAVRLAVAGGVQGAVRRVLTLRR